MNRLAAILPASNVLVDVDATRSAILLEWVPDSAELTAGAWGIADVAGLIGDLYMPRRTLPAGVPLARERVGFVFELWDRRRRSLRESPIGAKVWRRCREAALDMANEGDSLLHGDLHPGNILRPGTGSRIIAISLARRGARTEDVTLSRNLAITR